MGRVWWESGEWGGFARERDRVYSGRGKTCQGRGEGVPEEGDGMPGVGVPGDGKSVLRVSQMWILSLALFLSRLRV